MLKFLSQLTRKQALLIVVVLFFIPFPTQAIPEWKIQVVDEKNQPLSNVQVLQYWDNYTYWGYYDRRENTYTDENGFATFSPKYIWVSAISRIIFPPIAFLSQMAHGSAGTHSSIRTIDENYTTEFTSSWDDGEIIYFHRSESFQNKLVTKRISSGKTKSKENERKSKSEQMGNLKID